MSREKSLEEELDALRMENEALRDKARAEEGPADVSEAWSKIQFVAGVTHDAISLVDRAYCYQAANGAYLEAMGKSFEDIQGKDVGTLWGREIFETVLRGYFDRCFSGFTVHYASWFTFGGTPGYYEVSYYPLTDDEGEVTHAVVFTRDRTEHKRLAEALVRSEANYKSIFENLTEGYYRADLDGRLENASPSALAMLGFEDLDEIKGCKLAETLWIDPEERAGFVDDLTHYGEVHGRMVRLQRKDGSEIVVEVSSRLAHDDRGMNVIGVEGVFRDVTQRLQMQEQLERTGALNEALLRLGQEMLDTSELGELTDHVLRAALELTGSPYGYVGYIDPETGHNVVPTMTAEVWDHCEVPGKSVVFEHFNGLWGWVLKEKQPLLTNDPAGDPRSEGVPPGHLVVQRFLSVPALRGDEVVGQIAVINADRDYTEADQRALEQLAVFFALGLSLSLPRKAGRAES